MRIALRQIVPHVMCGLAGSALAGYVTFDLAGTGGASLGPLGATIFDPSRLASQSVSVGLIAALILALVRAGKAPACLAVAAAWSALMLGQAIGAGGGAVLVARPLWALALSGGIFLTALVFDALAREGIRIGKFLITAPLVAGFYVAAAPAVLSGTSAGLGLAHDLLMFALTGLVIGNGTALGIEIAEFFVPLSTAPATPTEDSGN